MKTYKLFWTLLATASLIMGCQKESNPLAQLEQNISDLVYQAENESDQITPTYNGNLQTIEIAHFGLSYDYLLTTKIPALCGYYDYNDINFEYFRESNFNRVNWESYSPSTKESLNVIIQKFENKQLPFIQNAEAILNNCNDSLNKYLCNQQRLLNQKEISKKDYDSIMTGVPDTFLKLFRSNLEDNKIRINCSANFRQMLQEIQNTLSQTQWEEFFQCIHRK
jgi:hypothetical protein